eukprot:scaffold57411_cov20-Tisochrysis_lutea.AAC.1
MLPSQAARVNRVCDNMPSIILHRTDVNMYGIRAWSWPNLRVASVTAGGCGDRHHPSVLCGCKNAGASSCLC